MTTYTTHMQILAQLVAGRMAAGDSAQSTSENIDLLSQLASRVIRQSKLDEPIPASQSRGPG